MKKFPPLTRYTVKNLEKYIGDATNIIARSSWELKFFIFCDTNPSILKWGSEEIVIPYVKPTDNRVHRYFPDFIIMYKDTKGNIHKEVVEIKPAAQTKMPDKKRNTKRYLQEVETYAINTAKWQAATKWSKDRGLTFRILTERELGIRR